jgi:glutathione S-transferase
MRLFGKGQEDVRVVLYRDNHAWCPYCQKVWLWLEEKQIPYETKKVTMFCYGEKERWYKKVVPSGMLPALQLDGSVITESDDILMALEREFGPLTASMDDGNVRQLRQLERMLFSAWCRWLCYPSSAAADRQNQEQFQEVVNVVEQALSSSEGPYFLDAFSVADTVFTPYVERMNASLFYYKGYLLRSDQNPNFSAWFDAMESRETYRGTQSDFHTHVHDLPPQMGGCYENGTSAQQHNKKLVDQGPWQDLPDVKFQEPDDAKEVALARVIKHKENILKANPSDEIDDALRCALTYMVTGEPIRPPMGSDEGLRYLRDRINVPRDMPIHSARHLRDALEATASMLGSKAGAEIPVKHRRDQDPLDFR